MEITIGTREQVVAGDEPRLRREVQLHHCQARGDRLA